MAATLLVLLFVLFGLQYHSRSQAYHRVTARMEEIAAEMFPELNSIPPGPRRLSVMTQRLEQDKREMDLFQPLSPASLSVLDILREVTEAVPKEVRLDVREFQSDEVKGTVEIKIEGETDSYNSAEQLKTNLLASGTFTSVGNPEYKSSVDQSKVKFVMKFQISQKAMREAT